MLSPNPPARGCGYLPALERPLEREDPESGIVLPLLSTQRGAVISNGQHRALAGL